MALFNGMIYDSRTLLKFLKRELVIADYTLFFLKKYFYFCWKITFIFVCKNIFFIFVWRKYFISVYIIIR